MIDKSEIPEIDWVRCEFNAGTILNDFLQWHLEGEGSAEGAD